MTQTTGSIKGIMVIAAGMIALAAALAANEQPRRTANPAANTQPAKLSPGDIETTASRVFIFVDKTGFGHQHAIAGRIKQGNLHIDATPAGEIIFDITSFVADTVDARRYIGLSGETDAGTQQQVTANMLGADVLDSGNFPTATFTVKSLQLLSSKNRKGNPQYQLEGDFSLHGVSRHLKIIAQGTAERGYLHLRGTFSIRQTDFGIRPFTKALGAVGVADKLTIYGDLWIVGETRPTRVSQKTQP